MRPEIELLLLCASPTKNAERSARARQLLDGTLDWDHLVNLADSHRLMPRVYWELKSLRPDAIPASLEEAFRQNTRNSLLLTQELIRILELFDREAIPAIPFKGPTLAVRAYGNLALRSFDDLDIFVREADVWRARDLLEREGYKANRRLPEKLQKPYIRSYDELLLHDPGKTLLLELHWAFLPRHFSVSLDTALFWQRTELVSIGSRQVPTLGNEDLMLVLCLHGAKHCWSHLGLICDVAWLAAGKALCWDTLIQRARDAGALRMLLLALALAARTLDAPLAEPVARGIAADPEVTTLSAEIAAKLFGARHDERSILRSGILHVRMRERLRDRLLYTFRLATRPGVEDWEMFNLPASLSFLYPLLRIPRLALKNRPRIS